MVTHLIQVVDVSTKDATIQLEIPGVMAVITTVRVKMVKQGSSDV